MKDIRLPGLALGIVQGNQIVHLRGFGVTDPSGRPVTPQTPFHMASLGKSFTALAIMQLVEANKVELDAPVQRYLPWFRVEDAEDSTLITVRHLLNQTSGISTASDRELIAQNPSGPDAIERSVRALVTVKLDRTVGESFEYANMNYVILGMIVQTVSGQPYAEYIQQHIFTPLEMSTAFLDSSEDQERNAALGHAYWFGFPRPTPLLHVPSHQPAGADSFSASVEDMSHYLLAQLNGGRYGENTILSPDGIALPHQPAVPTGAPNSFYGMGWEQNVISGVPVLQHTGAVGGFYSHMLLMPADRWGVIVLMNADATFFSERTVAIVPAIVNLLHGQTPAPAPSNSRWQLYAILSMIAVIQIAGVIHFVRLTRRWRLQPERRPASRGAMYWHIGLPLLINFGWGSFILILLPKLINMPLRLLSTFLPDATVVLALSAVMALGWSFLRTVLAFDALHNVKMPVEQSRQRRFVNQ
jgi:CubicO group peptidase (beta-lactamase class C family)